MKRKRNRKPATGYDGDVRLRRVLDLYQKHRFQSEIPADLYSEGRSCGTCTACCVIPGIRPVDLDEEEAKLVPPKRPDTPCIHCTGTGCAIYDKRPSLCREFECAYIAGVTRERPDEMDVPVTWTLRDTADTAHIEGMWLQFVGQCADVDKALASPQVREQIKQLASASRLGIVRKVILCSNDDQVGIDLTGHMSDMRVKNLAPDDTYQATPDMTTNRSISLPWVPSSLRRCPVTHPDHSPTLRTSRRL